MAKSNQELITALRQTANRLSQDVHYEWGHMGRCNMGHLVQTITHMSDAEIVASIDYQLDEWTEHANDYCAGTGHKLEDLFITLENVGFYRDDVIHLENLSDMQVLDRLPGGRRYLQRNNLDDVKTYIETLAAMLEEELLV